MTLNGGGGSPQDLPSTRRAQRITGNGTQPVKRSGGRMARTGEVLNLVRLGKVETVTELAKSMGLARSTVNERLDILQQIGLLTTGGETSPGRGRPASLLAFNAAAGVTLVAQVGMSGTMLAITDLDAEILWRTQVQFDVSHGPDALIELICTVFGDALAELEISADQVYGVGLGLPGDVEISTAPASNRAGGSRAWVNFPFAERLSQSFHAPSFVDRDVNLMAIGEHRTGWRDANVLVSLKVGTVVACGLVINHNVVRGATGMVGEIGHTKIAGVDLPCPCGSRGCLNTIAGGPALAASLVEQGFQAHTARDVADLANSGIVPAGQAVREAGRHVGEVMASVINLLNPDVVTVWGYLVDAGDQFLVGMQESIYKSALPSSARATVITRARLGDDAGLRGAALAVIEDALAPEAIDELVATADAG
ncbi:MULTISPECIES: ROK family transcriptional regulator [Rhodococcus]|nr:MULTISPECIES: ROK family protein [Rhodococcus]